MVFNIKNAFLFGWIETMDIVRKIWKQPHSYLSCSVVDEAKNYRLLRSKINRIFHIVFVLWGP